MRHTAAALCAVAAFGFLNLGPAQAAPQVSPLDSSIELDPQWHLNSDTLPLSFTLTNPTKRTVHLLQWQTPLNGVEKELFVVTRDGAPVTYLGKIVDYGEPQLRHFVELGADESISVEIDNLAALYDLSEPGLYEVRFAVPVLQGIVGERAELDRMTGNFLGQLVSNSVEFWTDGIARPAADIERVSSTIDSYQACRPSKRADLETALDNAAMIADRSVDYLADNGGDDLYEYWFGNYTQARFGTVSDNYDAIADALNNEGIDFSCACKSPAYAYVYPSDPYKIYLCSAFWRAPALGRDSKAGTLVHEMSHFNVVAGTDDIVYGASGAHNLALTSPSQAIRNADNHEYFAEDQAM